MASQTMDVSAAVEKLGRLAEDLRTTEPGDQRDKLSDEYQRQLDQLLDSGWPGALGAEREIPDDSLPLRYLQQRAKVIEDLEIQLGNWATKYRMAPKGSEADAEAIQGYHRVFAELLRVTGRPIGLDPDSELPDEDMPRAYVDYWK